MSLFPIYLTGSFLFFVGIDCYFKPRDRIFFLHLAGNLILTYHWITEIPEYHPIFMGVLHYYTGTGTIFGYPDIPGLELFVTLIPHDQVWILYTLHVLWTMSRFVK